MTRLTEWLLTSPPHWRLTLWCLLMLLLAGGLWFSLLAPARQQQATAASTYQQLRQQQQTLQHKLRHLPTPEIEPPVSVSQPAPLPVFRLAQTDGITLLRWQPGDSATSPDQLELYADWQQIPPLFDTLAAHLALPRAFSLQASQQHLKLTLQLEHPHETLPVTVTD